MKLVSVVVAVLSLAGGLANGLVLSTGDATKTLATQLGVGLKEGLQAQGAFKRPTAAVLLVVDGESPANDEPLTTFLKTLHKSESELRSVKQVLEEEKVEELRTLANKAFAKTTSAVEEKEMVEAYYRVNQNNVVEEFLKDSKCHARTKVVVVDKDEARLRSELLLVDKVVKDTLADKEARPVIVVGLVHGLASRSSQSRSQSLTELANGIEAIAKLLQSSSSRPVLHIVFTEKRLGPAPAIVSESFAVESRRLQSSATRVPFQGSDYVIMFWTIVILGLIVIFVFLCIPWAPELDAALKSTLKADNKRD